MIDSKAFEDAITKAAADAVQREFQALDVSAFRASAVAAVLEKPFIEHPGDVQLLLDIGRTTAWALTKDADFPSRTEIGRRQFIRTADFVQYVLTRPKVASPAADDQTAA